MLKTLAIVAAVLLPATGSYQPSTELRVLFIGNSLTAMNDLPSLVRRIGDADGVKIRTGMVAANDFGLEEHWKDGRAVREIRLSRWDVVVLQQGPSSLPESRTMLRAYAAKFASVIREKGARPAIYMVWPAKPYSASFERVSESHALAAGDVNGILLPAGDAWRAAWAKEPGAPLYAADNFHPSPQGSWVAALVIYCGITERAPAVVQLPRGFPSPELFRDSATEALRRVKP